jgi:predicted secreted protein
MNKSFSRIFICILIFCIGMFLAGCDMERDTPSSSLSAESEGSGTLLVSSQDNGTSKQMSVGETLEISLIESSADGKIWKVEDFDPSVLYQASEGYEDVPLGPDFASSTVGIVSVRFEALRAGQTPVTMVYAKPLANAVPADTFQIQVVVNGN